MTDAFASDAGIVTNPVPEQNSQNVPLLEASPNPEPKASATSSDPVIDDSALVADTGPAGTADDVNNDESAASDQISIYVVHKGDTIAQVAAMYDVSVNTILYANDLKKGQALTEGQTLIILPVTGVRYTIKKGDNLASIAKKFGLTDSGDIQDFNDITDSSTLSIGQTLIIPGVELSGEVQATVKPKTTPKGSSHLPSSPAQSSGSASGYYIKPIPCPLTQGKHDHYAVDMSCHESGTPIKAAATGTVIFAHYGYNGGFGNLTIIQHGNGTQTFYAHQSHISVTQGQHVTQGEIIGNVGSTGHSTGPHLHFEVRGAKNPGFDPTGNSWKKQ